MVNEVLKSRMVTCSDQMVVIPQFWIQALLAATRAVWRGLQGFLGVEWTHERQCSCRLIMVLVLDDLALPLPGNLRVLCNCEPTSLWTSLVKQTALLPAKPVQRETRRLRLLCPTLRSP